MGVARALEQLPSHMTPKETMRLLNFMIPGKHTKYNYASVVA